MLMQHSNQQWASKPTIFFALSFFQSVSSPHFSSVLGSKQLWRKSVSGFSFTCNKYPLQFTDDKSNNSWMRGGIPSDALNLFERLYKCHTPKSVSGERSKAWALSVVLCYLDNVIGFPDTYLLDNDLFIQLHSVEYKINSTHKGVWIFHAICTPVD